MTFGRFAIPAVVVFMCTVLRADPPLVCQIPTPAQCDAFIRVQCLETDPGYDVEWEEQFDGEVSLGWKPIFVVPPCDAEETVRINTDDETQCGGVSDDGTHIGEIEESHKVCWVTRACLTAAKEQGGNPIVTLNWRTEPNGGGQPITGKTESHQRHLCQPVVADPGTIIAGDDETKLDWFKCVPYSNCVNEG